MLNLACEYIRHDTCITSDGGIRGNRYDLCFTLNIYIYRKYVMYFCSLLVYLLLMYVTTLASISLFIIYLLIFHVHSNTLTDPTHIFPHLATQSSIHIY
jgi:hypothetical protein